MVLEPVHTYLPIKLGCTVDPDNITPSPGEMSDERKRPREGESCGDGGGGEEEEEGGEAVEAAATGTTAGTICVGSVEAILTNVKRGEVPPTSTCFVVLVEGGREEKMASSSPLGANNGIDANTFALGIP